MPINKPIYTDLSWSGRAALLILFLVTVNAALVVLFFRMKNVNETELQKLIGPALLVLFSIFLNYKLKVHCRKDSYSWKHATVNFVYNFITILALICLAFWGGKINYYIISYVVLLSYFFTNSAFEFGKKEIVEDFGK